MRKVSITSVLISLALPAVLNLEKFGCCIFIVAFWVVSILLARKFAPDMFA